MNTCEVTCRVARSFRQEHSPSSLLVVDLGHIAFRRDDTMVGSRIDISPGDNSPVSPIHDVEAEGKQMVASYPLGGSELDLVAKNDWRLDVSGVQVRAKLSAC